MVSTTQKTMKKGSSSTTSSSYSSTHKKVGNTKDAPHRCVYIKTGSIDKTPKYYVATIVDGKRKFKVYKGNVKMLQKNGRVKQRGGEMNGFLTNVQSNPEIRKDTILKVILGYHDTGENVFVQLRKIGDRDLYYKVKLSDMYPKEQSFRNLYNTIETSRVVTMVLEDTPGYPDIKDVKIKIGSDDYDFTTKVITIA